MKKIFVLIAFLSLLAVSLAMAKGGPYTLTSCTDTDGDDPLSPGNVEWADTDFSGEEFGSGAKGDVCSEIHYLNVMLYAGEKFKFGEAVLVEGVCPEIGTIAEEPGDMPVMKYYKCKCENNADETTKSTSGTPAVCTGPAVEIPYDEVKAADEKWMAAGKKDLHPWLARFLRLFGLWG
ncbi:MAG: hypothetical protein PHO02_07005 [Candidatus Nanoarchaeia archaeon]|nr:hypothetical protein [Candidatus Nanoarchaeia archaeon]